MAPIVQMYTAVVHVYAIKSANNQAQDAVNIIVGMYILRNNQQSILQQALAASCEVCGHPNFRLICLSKFTKDLLC